MTDYEFSVELICKEQGSIEDAIESDELFGSIHADVKKLFPRMVEPVFIGPDDTRWTVGVVEDYENALYKLSEKYQNVVFVVYATSYMSGCYGVEKVVFKNGEIISSEDLI